MHELAFNYGKKSSADYLRAYVSSKDSFILKDIFLNANVINDSGLINVFSVKGINWADFWKNLASEYNIADPKTIKDPIKLLCEPIHKANPLQLASLATTGKKANEVILKSETLITILHLSQNEKNKQFWELVSLTTSVIGTAGAIRVLTIGGASVLAKTLATIEIAKEATELAMLQPEVKDTLKKNGLEWLVKHWTKISIATDITTFGLDGLVNIIKNASKGAKVLKEAGHLKEAELLKKQTEKAFNEIENATGVNVRNMSDAEFDNFVKDNPVLATTESKVRKNSMERWTDYGQSVKGTKKFRPHEIESFIAVEKKFNIRTVEAPKGAAGDIKVIEGPAEWIGKFIDVAGLDSKAISAWKY